MQLFQRHAENDQETGRAKFFEKSVVDLWKVRMFEFCGINIALWQNLSLTLQMQ